MKNEITRKEAAELMKVSVPTFRKFLEEHRDVLENNKVSLKKLGELITEESERTLNNR
jgi:predicted DNA-binding protein (UPF0251 family)